MKGLSPAVLSRLIVVSLLLLLFFSVAQGAVRPQQYENIEEKIAMEGAANVIIRLVDPPPKRIQGDLPLARVEALNREVIIRLLQDGFTEHHDHPIINGFSGRITRAGLRKLRRMGIRYQIDEDLPASILPVGQESRPFRLDDVALHLSTSVKVIGANYTRKVLNITGRNITVAVIDTGIDYTHPDLGGCFGVGCRVRGGYDFYNDDADPKDDQGHGTHVAGIIGANGTVVGVAPEVSFFALKVCSNTGQSCPTSDIISAIQWAADNHSDVISMSLGANYASTPTGLAGKDPLSMAAQNAVAQGVTVVVSAGNDGAGASTIAAPGLAPGVITVGNVNDQRTIPIDDDAVSADSSRGPGGYGRLDPDVSAPGTSITSTWLGSSYNTLSGTSMAAPHVSGVAALLLSEDNNLTPAQVRARILGSARNITGNVFAKGSGELSAKEAVEDKVYAQLSAKDSFGQQSTSDRWEFIADPFSAHGANITLFNQNTYNVTFTFSYDSFENMENSTILDGFSLGLPDNVTVLSGSNLTFPINFSLPDMSNVFRTTYGSLLHLQGVGSPPENVSKEVSIPVVVTIPLVNYHSSLRIFDTSGASLGDNYVYAYYNNRSGNDQIRVNWSTSSSDLDLSLYNISGSVIGFNGTSGTDQESLVDTDTGLITWIRIQAYSLAQATVGFFLNVTDLDNHPPNITSISDLQGNTVLSFFFAENATLLVSYDDLDNDSVALAINDSGFVLQNSTPGSNATYRKALDGTPIGNHSIAVTLEDTYGARASQSFILTVKNASLRIVSFQPVSLSPTLRKNRSISFNQTTSRYPSIPLAYRWYVDGILNSTSGNFTFNSTLYAPADYNITFFAGDNQTNVSLTWILSLLAENHPVLFNGTRNITGLSWEQGKNRTLAINLSSFFLDSDNDTLTYTLMNASNITLQADNQSRASFFADTSITGIRRAWIVANDSETNASSNVFYLNITAVSVPVTPPAEEEAQVSSGSGGGGGGGGISLPRAESFSSYFQSASGTLSVTGGGSKVAVESLDIVLFGTSNDVDITVTQLKEPSFPASVSSFSGTAYKVIEIEHQGLPEVGINRAVITFRINNSWLKQEGIATGDVVLFRHDQSWIVLPTRHVSSDKDYQHYEAISPGLSTFIIGSLHRAAASVPEHPVQENGSGDASSASGLQKTFEEPVAAIHEEGPTVLEGSSAQDASGAEGEGDGTHEQRMQGFLSVSRKEVSSFYVMILVILGAVMLGVTFWAELEHRRHETVRKQLDQQMLRHNRETHPPPVPNNRDS
ncbi:MAG: S8 family serine peptidase [DPANN group archaeon]|nr:S8 family serine peptidase [DPANN group archaeon]